MGMLLQNISLPKGKNSTDVQVSLEETISMMETSGLSGWSGSLMVQIQIP